MPGRKGHPLPIWPAISNPNTDENTQKHKHRWPLHRGLSERLYIFIHCLFSQHLLKQSALPCSPFPVCLSSASPIWSGWLKYVTLVVFSFRKNAWCIKWIDHLRHIFMVRLSWIYGQREDGMRWRQKRGQILQLPPNWFPLVWWRE